MSDGPKIGAAELSRRSMLRNLALSAGGAAMLGTAVSKSRDAAAQTKATQKAVAYQGTPHGAQRCDNCLQFQPPSSCKTVEGKIAPEGWCKIYVKKPA
jgi:High potential iron-sulfur protein